MKPVRFSLDDLNVESFYTTESGAQLRGTVLGYTDPTTTNNCTPEESEATPTCVWYFSCDQGCGDPATYIGCNTGNDCQDVTEGWPCNVSWAGPCS